MTENDFNIVSNEEFALIERMRKEKQHEEYKYLNLLIKTKESTHE